MNEAVYRTPPSQRRDPSGLIEFVQNYGLPLIQAASWVGYNMGAYASVIKPREEVSKMLERIIDPIKKFCADKCNIHSSWVNVDQSSKDVVILTVLDEIDPELETAIFQGPYKEIPYKFEGYFIEPKVTFLCDNPISDVVTSAYKKIYSREGQCPAL